MMQVGVLVHQEHRDVCLHRRCRFKVPPVAPISVTSPESEDPGLTSNRGSATMLAQPSNAHAMATACSMASAAWARSSRIGSRTVWACSSCLARSPAIC